MSFFSDLTRGAELRGPDAVLLLPRLAKLIPPPYKHRVRYFGVFAPNAKLREAVVSSAGPAAALQSRLSDAARKMGIEG